MSDQKCHEFDSSMTCNFCGIAAERVPGGFAERQPCPARTSPSRPTPTDSDREAAREWAIKYTDAVQASVIGEGDLWPDFNDVKDAFLAGLAAARPTWTGTRPTESGLYGWRVSPEDKDWDVVKLVWRQGKFWVVGRDNYDRPLTHALYHHPACQWSDRPIPTPAEPTV